MILLNPSALWICRNSGHEGCVDLERSNRQLCSIKGDDDVDFEVADGRSTRMWDLMIAFFWSLLVAGRRMALLSDSGGGVEMVGAL